MFAYVLITVLIIVFSFNCQAAKARHYSIKEGAVTPNQVPAKGIGSVEKSVLIKHEGWYELFVHSAPWPTDLFLDGKRLGHFSFTSKAWPGSEKYKALNIYLKPGQHKLRFERLYHPGLPYIRSVRLSASSNLAGKVSLIPASDTMVYRAGGKAAMQLTAARLSSAYVINFAIKNAFTGEVIHILVKEIPSGSGLFNEDIHFPTDKEGVFNVEVKQLYYGQVARPFQYVVIDTSSITAATTNTDTKKELVRRIVPAQTKPDYASPNLSINTQSPTIGSYIESSGNGVYGAKETPDYFAYKLNLPDSSGFYLAEIDYPDNEPRVFTISLVEKGVSPYALDSGVITGDEYPLSQNIQTTRIYFHAREYNPRLLFLNWHQGKRIAVSEIRIYRVDENSLPSLLGATKSERKFSAFYEEPMRFTSYFGAKPTGNDWTEIYTTAQRWAKWSNFVGQNQWLQSIANYQHTMWPTDLLPGYAPSDESGFSLLGPVTPYDMHKKDVVRLLLLMAEKYNIAFVGELVIPASGYIQEAMNSRFNTAVTSTEPLSSSPWLLVSDQGKVGGKSPFLPYFNPVHPEVQSWIEDIVTELALRYADSPAFTGLAIRLMSWSFSSWQAFPSIFWGYGDYTINKFEQETGIKLPVSMHAKDRFAKRYKWLVKNHYEDWVNWRVFSITAFHKKLLEILKSARPDLKLYINSFGPDYSQADWGRHGGWSSRYNKLDKLDWHKFIRESGVDPLQYSDDSGIIFSNSFKYPAGVRAEFKADGVAAKKLASLQWKEANDPRPIKISARKRTSGTVSAARFDNAYMEYHFPVEWIGYDKLTWKKSKTLNIVAAINPPGRAVLRRYAWAMAEGNIDFMIDGGLGYINGEPSLLRSFFSDYHSLPAIGMTRFSVAGGIAIWHGEYEGKSYVYLVNKEAAENSHTLRFSGSSDFSRAATGDVFRTGSENEINLTLKPYELIVLESNKAGIKPVSHEISIP